MRSVIILIDVNLKNKTENVVEKYNFRYLTMVSSSFKIINNKTFVIEGR